MAGFPEHIDIVEVGPREGFQFEGRTDPQRISTARKLDLIRSLAGTGLRTIQVASFVNRTAMPQMADAEELCAALPQADDVAFTAIYLSDSGLRRALGAPRIAVPAELTLSASTAFALRNQRRTPEAEIDMQRRIAATLAAHGHAPDTISIMAAFGCNWEGEIAADRVLAQVAELLAIAGDAGGKVRLVNLCDTMGWAGPSKVQRLVEKVRSAWPELRIGLHLHDTRGLGIANVYAALEIGVDHFDCALGGLGGCPFAGHAGAAGNVATEEVLLLCRELGIATGIDLGRLLPSARLAEDIVGRPLLSKVRQS